MGTSWGDVVPQETLHYLNTFKIQALLKELQRA
jgi:hypothetical protein